MTQVLKVPLVYFMDDRTEPFEVQADQRDLAAWEAQPEAENDRAWAHTRFRFLAWHAAKRQGLTDLTWSAFSDKCIQTTENSDETQAESEGEQEGDPTISV